MLNNDPDAFSSHLAGQRSCKGMRRMRKPWGNRCGASLKLAQELHGGLDALNSNARNAISSQSFSCKRKCLVTDARESL